MIDGFISILFEYKVALVRGVFVTLELAIITWISGILLGSVLGFLSSKYPQTIGKITKIASFFLASIPILVILFWFHYPLQAIFNLVIDPFITSAFVLSVVNIFFITEIVSTALNEFPKQYIIAGLVSGMKESEIFKKIQVPIIFRQIIPGLLTSQVTMLHLTLFAGLISVGEILRVTQNINSLIYSPVELYTAVALFFLIICVPLNGLAIYLKKKFTRNFSER